MKGSLAFIAHPVGRGLDAFTIASHAVVPIPHRIFLSRCGSDPEKSRSGILDKRTAWMVIKWQALFQSPKADRRSSAALLLSWNGCNGTADAAGWC